ncbi:conserved hypothetical protein [Flavobacterium sp. 9AF]|uniref:carboxypeptidase-like regulatory domain-containing protein n=1 Tax=Flavobacterium sp. 9AF TaxID=2653142 RepID=UPI0012F1C4C9|nr:carboxypeptidase-like regulatory domain-containing protein [Flavobacterium sp. 9AF]VXC19135.1 conserved hypothetical protein [Flavobacterium sp. 9AF]
MNTITKINLSKIKKCHQYWEDMPENEKGRLCLQCNHTIIDFRKSTDAEIAQAHIFSEDKVCGLYHKEQLEFASSANKGRNRTRWNAFYIGLFSFLSWNTLGQEKSHEINVEQTDKKLSVNPNITVKKQEQDSSIVKEMIFISGTITDEKGLVLPGAYVIVTGTDIGANSNENGFYKLDITDVIESLEKVNLVFGYVGYKQILWSEDKTYFEQIKDVKVNVQFTEPVELSVFYIYSKKVPLHKRIWYKIRNVFRKK